MKKILILAIVPIIAFGCATEPTKEQIDANRTEKAKTIIAQYLDAKMAEDGGCEHLEYGALDSVYSAPDSARIKFCKWRIERAEYMLPVYKRFNDKKSIAEAEGDIKAFGDSLKMAEAEVAAFVPELIALEMSHKYKGKEGALAKITAEGFFKIDTALMQVLDVREGEIDFGDLTLADIINSANVEDLMK